MNDQDNAGATHASASHADTTEPKDPYAIREEYALAERSTKIIARLNIMLGGLVVIIGLVSLAASAESGGGAGANAGIGLLFLLFGGAAIWIGIELVMLKPWAPIAMTVLYIPTLLFIPIGTIIGGCIIWALMNKKARFVCSDEYQRIVAATPDYGQHARSGAKRVGQAQQNEESMKRAAQGVATSKEAQRGPTRDDRRQFIEGAKQCLSYSMRESLCPLDDFARDSLTQVYGQAWLQENEGLLRAMLTFVDEYKMLTDDELREFAEEDAATSCLLNIFNCMRLAGAFDQPIIAKGKPDFSGFALAFSKGDFLAATSDPKSPSFVLMLSVKAASAGAVRKSA